MLAPLSSPMNNTGIVPPWMGNPATNPGTVPPWVTAPIHTLPVEDADAGFHTFESPAAATATVFEAAAPLELGADLAAAIRSLG